MFKATDTPWAPWYVVRRLNMITHMLEHIPYEEAPQQKMNPPERQKAQGYKDPDYPFKVVPELNRGTS